MQIARNNNNLFIILIIDGEIIDLAFRHQIEEMVDLFIETKLSVGVSAAYSIGLENVKTDYFQIFSDDDDWHFTEVIELMKNIQKDSINAGLVRVIDELGEETRSPHFEDSLPPLQNVYAPIVPWKRNRVFYHLTSMIFPRDASIIKFRKDLIIREDLAWLQDLYGSGFEFVQTRYVLSTVYPLHSRSSQRQTLEIDRDWIILLNQLSKEIGTNFFYFHLFRSLALSGDLRGIFKRCFSLQKIVNRPNFKQFSSIMIYLLLASIKSFSKFKRLNR
jgi:glycosyltransferase involved in cell wall biosynthesis